ncbi:MAG: hypothetical protein H7Z43_01020 [Clostridia bacterium]|nr:hypothetical protein [Deltaproteobacteria bacterium]
MARERWSPPPMKPTADPSAQKDQDRKLTVDENIVRKMLKVNPTLRQGRTTSQVKKSLEQGDSLTGAKSGASANRTGADASSALEATRSGSLPISAAELRDTVTFFLRSKLEALTATEAEIANRRVALDAELESAQTTLRYQVRSFLGLLDQTTLAQHGPAALADHAKNLARVGIDTKTLIEDVRRGVKK